MRAKKGSSISVYAWRPSHEAQHNNIKHVHPIVQSVAHCADGINGVKSKVRAVSGRVLMFTLHLLVGRRTLHSASSAVTSPTRHSCTLIVLGRSLSLCMPCLHRLTAPMGLLPPCHLSACTMKQVILTSQRAPQGWRCLSQTGGMCTKDQGTARFCSILT